ncbi:MAG: type II toxin-antitoxin system VapC family toxin [Candidatus Gracilibacteria bacterium]|jgi:predicted nucleic acid-binding protein
MSNIKLFVVDNSVLLKPILQEPEAEIVKKLLYLKDKFEISILVPDIFPYEFFNKLLKGLDPNLAFKAYETLMEKQISVVPLERDLMKICSRLMAKYSKISFYDAAYHALAKAYDAELITADEKYYQLVKKEGNIRLLKDLKL